MGRRKSTYVHTRTTFPMMNFARANLQKCMELDPFFAILVNRSLFHDCDHSHRHHLYRAQLYVCITYVANTTALPKIVVSNRFFTKRTTKKGNAAIQITANSVNIRIVALVRSIVVTGWWNHNRTVVRWIRFAHIRSARPPTKSTSKNWREFDKRAYVLRGIERRGEWGRDILLVLK